MVSAATLALKVFTSLPPALTRNFRLRKGFDDAVLPDFPECDSSKCNLLIGPANSAGQGHLWATAVNELPGWAGWNLQYRRSRGFSHQAHSVGLEGAVVYNPHWAKQLRRTIVQDFSAVIVESLLPLFGVVHLQDAAKEIRYLQRHGVNVAVLWHGSDIRNPQTHRDTTVGSVFFDAPPDSLQKLVRSTDQNHKKASDLDIQVFVSTPDLIRYQPTATWLPLQVEPAFLNEPVNARKVEVPTVLHMPSRSYLKGTDTIVREMQKLQDAGVILYVQPERLSHSEVREVMRQADIVIDQIGTDSYGVTTIEALALGKTVVGQVGDFVRDFVRRETLQEIPVLEADASTLSRVVAEVSGQPQKRLELGEEGRHYVTTVHSPNAAAAALAPFLERSRGCGKASS